MSTQDVIKKCCCDCWYRIPLCTCENDPSTCDKLYMECELLEQFFDDNPALDDCLVFERFDPDASDLECCYEMCRDPNLIVNTLPPDAVVLDMPPDPGTWYLPPFDDCVFCCPNPCCNRCPMPGNPADVCCWHPNDMGFASVTWTALNQVHHCCNPKQTITWTCPAGSASGPYEMVQCNGATIWVRAPEADPCLWSFWLAPCTGNDGWENSEDQFCGPVCTYDPPDPFCGDFTLKCCFDFESTNVPKPVCRGREWFIDEEFPLLIPCIDGHPPTDCDEITCTCVTFTQVWDVPETCCYWPMQDFCFPECPDDDVAPPSLDLHDPGVGL